jgi:hypothetical protein
MADTRRDDPNASSIVGLRALPVAAQTARENLPAIPDPGHGADGGEAHDIARASSPQTKGPSDGDGANNWNTLANVVVPQDPREEDQDGFTVPPPTPITGQGPPSFAQSEFYTVNFDSNSQPLLFSLLNSPLHVDCPSSMP